MKKMPFLFSLCVLSMGASLPVFADDWSDIQQGAEGQTVYFNAWGGSPAINAYIAWAGEQVSSRHNVSLVHVKLTNTADAVSRIVTEFGAGRTDDGSIDVIWINGENFRSLKEQGLLFGPFAEDLPNFDYVDTEGKPTTLIDFTIPVDGYEAPWGMAQFVIIRDTSNGAPAPETMDELAAWAAENPGRLTYPAPPDFIGTTFLKHVLIDRITEPAALEHAPDADKAAEQTAGIWTFLDDLHPNLWRSGNKFPASGPAQHQLLDDGEVDYSFAFNPAEASAMIAQGQLPETVRTSIFRNGTIGNSHFLAIPVNAAHDEGAQVVIDFMLSPEAQLMKQSPEGWGDFTVLAVSALSDEMQDAFASQERGIATLAPEQLTPVRHEPHPGWSAWLEDEWLKRYGS